MQANKRRDMNVYQKVGVKTDSHFMPLLLSIYNTGMVFFI